MRVGFRGRGAVSECDARTCVALLDQGVDGVGVVIDYVTSPAVNRAAPRPHGFLSIHVQDERHTSCRFTSTG